jgi:DNA-binding NtrC family response regulator
MTPTCDTRWSARSASGGHDIAEATNEPDGLEHAQSFDPALILSDINLAAGSGLSVLAKLRERGCDAPVILMTAFASVGSAVEAMKLGADDYLTKPFNLDELVLTVDRHLRNREQRSRLQLYERLDAQSRGPKAPGESMIGQSPIWKSVVELADRLARLPLPVDPGKAGTARSTRGQCASVHFDPRPHRHRQGRGCAVSP